MTTSTTRSPSRLLLEGLRRSSAAMVRDLELLVRAESPTRDRAAVRANLELLQGMLGDAGLEGRIHDFRGANPLLVAAPRNRRRGGPFQLLVGHCDTVWPTGTLDTMPALVRERRFHGPGAFDMKAGLVQMVWALRSALETGGEGAEGHAGPAVTPVVLVTSDEEEGSDDSRRAIVRLARIADRVFVAEPALGPEGLLKTTRKGIGGFVVHIEGRAAHAGLAPETGASAILELSHVVQRLHALNDAERGTTVNVGVIDGGLRPNVVAPVARAEVDVRVLSTGEGERIAAAIHALEPTVPGVRLRVEGGINRPPLERTPANRRLWRRARRAARALGLEIGEGVAGGASDGNITSLHAPTLDGLGAVGDGAHAHHEHVELDAMPERAALLALLLLEPALGGPRESSPA